MNASLITDVCDGTINLTSVVEADEALEDLTWSDTDKLLITIILPAVVTIGVIGNLVFLVTVARIKRMRTVTNYYLCNLAVADMLFLLISMGTQLYTYTHSRFEANIPASSIFSCWGSIFPVILSYFASVALVTLVSLERYYSICKPVQHQLLRGTYTFKVICLTWILSAALALLSIPRFGKLRIECVLWPDGEEYQDLPMVYTECDKINFTLGLISEIVRFLVFWIALVTNCIAYYKLIKHLSRRTKRNSRHYSKRNIEIRNQVARILIICGLAFFLFQLPSRLLNVDRFIRLHTGELDPNYGTIYSINFGILMLNSVVNPFIYGLGSQFYRQAFCEAFGIDSCFRIVTPAFSSSSNTDISTGNGHVPGYSVDNDETV